MRVLLVEDDMRAGSALTAVLRRHDIRVRRAHTGREALEALYAEHEEGLIDAVLLGRSLPDREATRVCARIRASSDVPVIMMTRRSTYATRAAHPARPARASGTGHVAVRSRARHLGTSADVYIDEPFTTAELLSRLSGLSGRRRAERDATRVIGLASDRMPVSVLADGLVSVDHVSRRVTVSGREVPLAPKEFDLLALLIRRPGVVLRRDQLPTAMWHTGTGALGRTLEVHIAGLRAKLGMPGLIETVRGVGYRWRAADGCN